MRHESTPWPGAPAGVRTRGLNSLYTRAQLEGVLQRERGRADRVRGEFSLILFRARGSEPRQTLRLARVLLRRCRTIDEIGWFADDCLAVLLPYTGAEGARAFATHALEMAQERSLPAACRIYTYPSAWYFGDDDDGNGHLISGRMDGTVAAETASASPGHNGNGHNGKGHNAHGHNGNGHNGNGYNGNGHNGNGHNGNGNGHRAHQDRALDQAESQLRDAADYQAYGGSLRGGESVSVALTSSRRQLSESLEASDLMPYLFQGARDELRLPDGEDVESLILRPLPRWKRVIDIAGAGIGLLALSPVMILCALAIKGTSRGPVLFRQRRAGRGGRSFWIYKFRTMVTDAEAKLAELRTKSEQDGPAFKLARDPRITPVGRILRETSLDELPQLWNVIKGDMSLVGPRPLPVDESAGCDQWQRRRLDVTPGLTCIWQVKGRSRVTFSEWMRMDLKYIHRRTFWHDLKILAATIPAVLMRRGAR